MHIIIYCTLSIRCLLKAPLNELWSFKVLIDNGKLFQRVHPEYTKLHLNRSILWRGITSLCECLFWLIKRLAISITIRVEGAQPVVILCISTPYYIPLLTPVEEHPKSCSHDLSKCWIQKG